MNITATLDLPYLRELALNMVSAVEADPTSLPQETVRANVLSLRACIDAFLSEEIVEERMEALKEASAAQVCAAPSQRRRAAQHTLV